MEGPEESAKREKVSALEAPCLANQSAGAL